MEAKLLEIEVTWGEEIHREMGKLRQVRRVLMINYVVLSNIFIHSVMLMFSRY